MINTINLPPFKKMCITIGNLPSSFMESMTYYEALCWLYDYFEKTLLPAINTNSEAITELQNAFNILKTYVDTYFENLDVQEEINTKLDEMAQSGELEEIIGAYLNTRAIFGFDDVASLKEATNLIDGSYVRTLGYYNINDGGGALYKVREVTNADTVDEMLLIALADEDLVAELVIENNCINIRQLGAKSLDTDLVKHDIASYINKYKTLVLNNKNSIKLYIPAGVWHTSPVLFEDPNNCFIYGDGEFSDGNNLACGTIISSMENNQSYIFSFGNGSGHYCTQFNVKDLTFSTADFVYDSTNNRFNYDSLKTIETAIKFDLATHGYTDNLYFIRIKGECLSIRSCWENFFGKLYFRFVTNHDGSIMRFRENIASWTNISANIFDYMMFESFHGDLIELEESCALYNNHFNTINVEDRTFIEDGEVYTSITQTIIDNWDDTDYTHLALFKLDAGARTGGNVISNIELNNVPESIVTWNSTNYVFDTIIDYNDDVTFANTLTNITAQGMLKNCIILRMGSDSYQTNSQTPKIYNLLNSSAFNFELQLKGLDDIYIGDTLNGVRNPTDANRKYYIYSNYGGWIPCYKTKSKYQTRKYLYSDSDTINELNIAVIPNPSTTYINNYSFTSLVNPNEKIYVRAKIASGERVKIYTDNLTRTGASKAIYLDGTGNYEIYEITLNTNCEIGDLIGVRLAGSESGISRNISFDSYISI